MLEHLFTPGPWFILHVMGKSFIAAKPTEDHPDHMRTRFIDVCGEDFYPRQEADMQLSKAAPDMLEALERVGCQFSSCPGPEQPVEDGVTCFVCAAIRKALVLTGPDRSAGC